jgi:hypothetical protein
MHGLVYVSDKAAIDGASGFGDTGEAQGELARSGRSRPVAFMAITAFWALGCMKSWLVGPKNFSG